MALINNIYVHVVDEDIDNSTETVTHPTESGFPIASSVKKEPITLNISGQIVKTDNLTAKQIIDKLKKLQKDGSLITYVGASGTHKNLQIQSFNTNYNNKNNGGADFDMSLKEVRIAKKAYVKQKETKVEEKAESGGIFKGYVGQTVIFMGGEVYVSSDAKQPTCTRQRSFCKITKISDLSNRIHIYHLVSQDCGYGSNHYVYGWVDAKNICASTKTVAKASSSGGTQQVKTLSNNKLTNKTTVAVK